MHDDKLARIRKLLAQAEDTAATTAEANARLPQSDSATSARRDHHTDRQPRPVATAAARAMAPRPTAT